MQEDDSFQYDNANGYLAALMQNEPNPIDKGHDEHMQNSIESEIDEDTGLYNKKRFKKFVRAETERINRTIEEGKTEPSEGVYSHEKRRSSVLTYSVLFLDGNGFKEINDTYGHTLGDKVMQVLAQTLESVLRDTDAVVEFKKEPSVAARCGGDEFGILLRNTDYEGAKRAIERIKEVLENVEVAYTAEESLTGQAGVIKMSISCGAGEHKIGEKYEQTLLTAEKEMYADKTRHKAAELKIGRELH